MRTALQKAIEACKNKSRIHLNNLEIQDNELDEIFASLGILNQTIVVLNLDGNRLTDVGACRLANLLEDMHLDELSLQDNQIGKEGAIAVFGLKRNLPNLDILFRGNQIVDVDVMADIEQRALDNKLQL